MNSYSNQQNAYRKASVNTLDQNKLIIMLYDGAIKQSGFALEHIKKNDIENALNRMPTKCDECGRAFDKKKHSELDSWRIAVYDEGPTNLVCPNCVPEDIR